MACGCNQSSCVDGLGWPDDGGAIGQFHSPVRRQWLVDRLDASTLGTPGKVINVPLDGVPLHNEHGWHAHVAAVKVVVVPQFDVVAASLPAAIPGYTLLSLISNIFLEDCTNWQFIAGLDGRSVRDDVVMRNYRLLTPDPADIPDSNATNLQIQTELYMPFTRHDDYGPTRRGLVPVAAFVGKGRQAFRFTCASELAGGNPVGLTYDGFQGDIQIWLDLIFLPTLSYTRWQLEHYTIQEQSGKLRHCDRWHEYAALRYFPEDTGGVDLDDFAGVTVQANGSILVNTINSSDDEIIRQNEMWLDADPDSDVSLFLNAGNTEATFAIFTGQHRRAIPASPYGPITFNYSQRADHDEGRYLHRTVSAAPRKALAKIAKVACMKRPAAREVVGPGTVKLGRAPGADVMIFSANEYATPGSAKLAEDTLI